MEGVGRHQQEVRFRESHPKGVFSTLKSSLDEVI